MTLSRVSFDELLGRAGDPTLEALLGSGALGLLRFIDPELLRGKKLRDVLLALRPAAHLLRDSGSRGRLLDLLQRPEAADLASDLGIKAGENVYDTLREVRVNRGSAKETSLFDFFGLTVPEPEAHLTAPAVRDVEPTYGLFVHQRRAVKEAMSYLKQPPRRVVLHMPTGAGKTRTAMHLIADHLRAAADGTAVCWLASTEELCEQSATEFETAWAALGDREVAIYRFWGDRSLDIAAVKDGIIVAGLAKMYSAAKQDLNFIPRLGDRVSLVVIDEAHQVIADTYELVVDTLASKRSETALLGLTATPGRTWNDLDEDRRLARFFGGRKVTLTVDGYPNPVDFLINKGYLARPTFKTLLNESSNDLTARDLADVASRFDIPVAVLRKVAANEQRSLKIVDAAEDLLSRHKRVLLFGTTVEHARLMATVLRARGHNAGLITADTPSDDRARTIAAFRRDDEEPMVLCNYGILTTGFDAPATSAALIARPTFSLVLYSQMVGRAIRGPLAGGNATAEILTVLDIDLPGFRDVSEAFTNWEDVWNE